MDIALEQHAQAAQGKSWAALPPRMRVLYITSYQRTGGWLTEALAAEGGSEVLLEQSVGGAAGMERLRDESFDAVLISHDPPELDALEMVEGIRTGGSNDAVILLGNASEQEMTAAALEAGASDYVCANTTTSRMLIWIVARAIERTELVRENQRLQQAERQRITLEHEEAGRLLAQQRAVIGNLESLFGQQPVDDLEVTPTVQGDAARGESPVATMLPPSLHNHYRELLRAYVIMGSGNLAEEMRALAEVLATANVSARQAMHMHLAVLEETVQGLGSRSARHVMNRADLLAMEIMVHLAEGYRQRLHEHFHPPQQLDLPGFE